MSHMTLPLARFALRCSPFYGRPVPTSAGAAVALTVAMTAALAVTLALMPAAPALAAGGADTVLLSTPYPGTIDLHVDATNLSQKIMRMHESVPVQPGPLTLLFPRWLPGTHSPVGAVGRLAGLKLSAGGKPLEWVRDTVDIDAFHVQVPDGVRRLELEFEHLSPVSPANGRVTMTPEMLNVQWNALVLYPSGWQAQAITVQASLVLPAGWQYATALRPAQQGGATTQFQPVSLYTLVDSPLFAGAYVRRIELDPPGTPRPVVLNIVADRPELLKPTDVQIEAHRELVRQADKLFGSRHYAHYDFLFAISDQLGGIGLEHHQSSEDGVKTTYWDDWDKRIGSRELLPHEYTHSWNGKFRRPQDLTTPNYNVPMGDTLLWVYEGQTQFWGWVLGARSGLTSVDQARERLANTAASLDHRVGRDWRNLQDTTNDPTLARELHKDWPSWQRTSGDYYEESLLIWLDADSLIRERSGGKRSMDDFAHAFFSVDDGQTGPLTYRFEDVVRTLNQVEPYDWAGFLRQRLDGHAKGAPLDGLARGGWHLVYTDKPSVAFKAREAETKTADFGYSIGLLLDNDGKIASVLWGSPAFAAGLAPAVTLVAVNQHAYKPELLSRAITANVQGQAPLDLLLRDGDVYRSVRIDYRGGLRYPALERVAGTEDRLTPLLTRR
jgi:predicted metalloprotease with PDZ domain